MYSAVSTSIDSEFNKFIEFLREYEQSDKTSTPVSESLALLIINKNKQAKMVTAQQSYNDFKVI